MGFSSILGGVQSFFTTLAGAGQAAQKAVPALSANVTFGEILTGVNVARTLPWAEITAAVDAQFRDPLKDAVAVEEIAAAVAAAIPAAATVAVSVEDVAKIVVLLCRLGIITGGDGKAPPPTAVPDAYGSPHGPPAPFI
jgi:hypothetical protein